MAHTYVETSKKPRPYTSLELAGRDIYVREGCYLCHSQMIRPMSSEYLRYGKPSTPEESLYDHPFQWGSKRTGPDLARVGGKYPDLWHFRHMIDPRDVTPSSIMPSYPWLARDKAELAILGRKLSVMKSLGVPYTDAEIAGAEDSARADAKRIAGLLEEQGAPKGMEDKEIVALIAYLQALGQMAEGGRK
jgi:cytochrome c oxidase cbb3-type subunit I/II